MKKIFSAVLALLLLSALAMPAAAQYSSEYCNVSAPSNLSKTLTSAVTLDMMTDSLMYSMRPSEKIYQTGGIVHLMTAYTAVRMYHENASVALSFKGTLLEELLVRMLYLSDDAAVDSLITSVSGEEQGFVREMNRYAAALGMSSTVYINADGAYSVQQYTTVTDLLALVKACVQDGQLSAILKGNVYYNEDKTLSYSRDVPVLSAQNALYDERICFFVSSDQNERGYLTVSAASDSSGRKILAAVYESGTNLSDFLQNYAPDLRKLYDNAFNSYYWAPLTDIAKNLSAELSYPLSSGAKVYVCAEFYEEDSRVATLPYQYAVLLASDYRKCEIVPDTAQLPDTVELGEIYTTAQLLYNGASLMKLKLRAVKIETADGVVRSEKFDLYTPSAYEAQITAQTPNNRWIFYAATALLAGAAAIVLAEILKRRMD